METEEASRGESGHVVCGSWIRRPKKVNWAIIAKAAKRRGSSSPPLLNIYSFDPITTSLSSSPLVHSFYFFNTVSFLKILVFWKRIKSLLGFGES